MAHIPSIELLDATHDFPCAYIFKAIGLTEQSFVARVVAAAREELQAETDPPYKLRHTAGGKHVAVTLELFVSTAVQVRALYSRLLTVPGLVVLF